MSCEMASVETGSREARINSGLPVGLSRSRGAFGILAAWLPRYVDLRLNVRVLDKRKD